MKFQWIRGNTGCLFLKGNAVPVYQLSRREWVLFDSGSRREEAALFSFLEENQIRVRAVLTSHSHYDHIGNHKTLRERFGSELVMSCLDAGMARDALALKSCFYSSSRTRLAQERP